VPEVGFFLESAWQRQLSGFLSQERHKNVTKPSFRRSKSRFCTIFCKKKIF
jgi:hypothetical protein